MSYIAYYVVLYIAYCAVLNIADSVAQFIANILEEYEQRDKVVDRREKAWISQIQKVVYITHAKNIHNRGNLCQLRMLNWPYLKKNSF